MIIETYAQTHKHLEVTRFDGKHRHALSHWLLEAMAQHRKTSGVVGRFHCKSEHSAARKNKMNMHLEEIPPVLPCNNAW